MDQNNEARDQNEDNMCRDIEADTVQVRILRSLPRSGHTERSVWCSPPHVNAVDDVLGWGRGPGDVGISFGARVGSEVAFWTPGTGVERI